MRPVDRVTASERKGRPNVVRRPAPRFPDFYPDFIYDWEGRPVAVHPMAGEPHPRAGQVALGTIELVDPDRPAETIVKAATGPAYWNPDGTPVDPDLVAGPPGFIAAGKAALGFGFRLRGNGGFITDHPNVGVVEVGAPEWLSPTGYRVLPLTQRAVVDNRVEWDSPQGQFVVAVKGGLVITELLVTAAEHNTGWRQSVSVEPPALLRGRYEGGFIVYDPVELDGTESWPLRVGL